MSAFTPFFNFFEIIMADALEDHEGSVNIVNTFIPRSLSGERGDNFIGFSYTSYSPFTASCLLIAIIVQSQELDWRRHLYIRRKAHSSDLGLLAIIMDDEALILCVRIVRMVVITMLMLMMMMVIMLMMMVMIMMMVVVVVMMLMVIMMVVVMVIMVIK